MKITSGRKKLSHLVLIHGLDGVGKTTLASEFPSPIFVGPELGTQEIDTCKRVEGINNLKDFMSALNMVHDLGTKANRTVVVDSLDWVQILIEEYVGPKHQKSFDAIQELKEIFLKIKNKLHLMRLDGFNVVLICHSTIAEFNDPSADQPYNRYELKLLKIKNNDTRALWREFVDAVIFLNRETLVTGKSKNTRAESTGVINMHLCPEARWEAKNRFGITQDLEYKIGQGYKTLLKAFSGREAKDARQRDNESKG